jgi:UDP-glucose:(heptosyl)LPS alpha-1,3-glucosyltransferase
MKIGLVRRGYSATGGAEAYLKRFARALRDAGHECLLFTSADWPASEWPDGEIEVIRGRSPLAFALALEKAHPRTRSRGACDYLFSLERIYACDAYRAGDGVHRAWLRRRDAFEPAWKRWTRGFNPKHRQLLELEARLFSNDGAGIVIANCRMVKEEIVREYGYPASRIHVVYNGLPPMPAPEPGAREKLRAQWGLAAEDTAILFAGSGWERKGLKAAVEAVRQMRGRPVLIVAGKGDPKTLGGAMDRVRFLGPVKNMPACYAAADVFVLPTFYDPFSNACLEALATGLPVVTTAANGVSEVLGACGDVIANPADSAAIARALEEWTDPNRRAAIRPRIAELISRFTIEANVKATLAAMETNSAKPLV